MKQFSILSSVTLLSAACVLSPPALAQEAGDRKPGDGGIALRWCPPGTFWMGSKDDEPGREEDEVRHEVTLPQGFWLGETEVTVAQWAVVMGRTQKDQVALLLADEGVYTIGDRSLTLRGHYRRWQGEEYETTLSNFVETEKHPIWAVSWEEAQSFCQRLTELGRKSGELGDGWEYRLPTEAQWEYAARAGTDHATYAGPLDIAGPMNAPILDAIAWYGGNSSVGYPEDKGLWIGGGRKWQKHYAPGRAGVHPVGEKQANPWGLHDMLGNIWESTSDMYRALPPTFEGSADLPEEETLASLRGGSWSREAIACRVANRYWNDKAIRHLNVGLRVALVQVKE